MSFFQKTTVEMKENQRYDQKIFLVFFFKKNIYSKEIMYKSKYLPLNYNKQV